MVSHRLFPLERRSGDAGLRFRASCRTRSATVGRRPLDLVCVNHRRPRHNAAANRCHTRHNHSCRRGGQSDRRCIGRRRQGRIACLSRQLGERIARREGTIVVLGAFRNSQLQRCHRCMQFSPLRAGHVVLILRNGNRGQNANDRNHDHQFDQSEAGLQLLVHALRFVHKNSVDVEEKREIDLLALHPCQILISQEPRAEVSVPGNYKRQITNSNTFTRRVTLFLSYFFLKMQQNDSKTCKKLVHRT